MVPVNMPQVGQDIAKATIIEWLKAEGDPVAAGEVIAVVESEKASFEVEADTDGVLLKRLYDAGDEGPVLEPIAWVGRPGDSVDDAAEAASETPPASAPAATAPATVAAPMTERLAVSPVARRLAAAHDVDLSTLTGTGPGGRIVKADVLAAAESPAAESPAAAPADALPETDTEVPFDRMRATIARRLTRAARTVPHFSIAVDVDMTDANRWRKTPAAGGVKITVTDIIIHATARALREYARLNAIVDETKLTLKPRVNIGVATAVDNGLLVPVIADAHVRSLSEIAVASREAAETARRGTLTSTAAGTFTVSSLGMYGVGRFTPIINAPECAILAVAAITPRVVPVGEAIGVRQMMTLTLACDHRAIDGPYAAAFLNRLKTALETDYRI
ncbi:MAG: dihydrolipoamide acetyltransferase family protein [Planctomycetota bacterium]